MDCLITNGKQYIRLDSNGSPQTCGQVLAERFSEDKAKKIVSDLQDVYEGKSVHPGGIVLVPQGDELHDYTPLAFTKDDQAITYFNYSNFALELAPMHLENSIITGIKIA